MKKYKLDTQCGEIHIGHLNPESFKDWSPDKEEWRAVTVEGFEHYEISNYGRCKNSGKNAKRPYLTGDLDKGGYVRYLMRNKDKKRKQLSHRLVCLSFLPTEDTGLTVDHINGVKTDNRLSNLQWMTFIDNAVKGIKDHTEAKGSKGFSSLTREEVKELIAMYEKGSGYKEICEHFNLTVRHDSVGAFLGGKRLKHTSGLEQSVRENRYRMSQEKANIYYSAVLLYGMMQKDAAELIGMSSVTGGKLLKDDKYLKYFENYIAYLTEGS